MCIFRCCFRCCLRLKLHEHISQWCFISGCASRTWRFSSSSSWNSAWQPLSKHWMASAFVAELVSSFRCRLAEECEPARFCSVWGDAVGCANRSRDGANPGDCNPSSLWGFFCSSRPFKLEQDYAFGCYLMVLDHPCTNLRRCIILVLISLCLDWF